MFFVPKSIIFGFVKHKNRDANIYSYVHNIHSYEHNYIC